MLDLKKWMNKVSNTLLDILSPTDYGSQFTHQYGGAICHIYKIGKIVFFQYGVQWGAFAANSVHNIGTLPTAVCPSYDQATVGQIHGSAASCITPVTIYFWSSDGHITVGTSGHLATTTGYVWFNCYYFLN